MSKEEVVKECFSALDANADGMLSLSEFQELFQALDPVKWTKENITLAFTDAAEGDDCIHYNKFLKWCFDRDKGEGFRAMLMAKLADCEQVNEEFQAQAAALFELVPSYEYNKYYFQLSKALQLDTQFLHRVYLQDKETFEALPDEAKTDRDYLLLAARRRAPVVNWVPAEIEEDAAFHKELMCHAISCAHIGDGEDYENKFLEWFPKDSPYWADKDVMKVMVVRKSKSLQFASQELRGDKDLVLRAVSCGGQRCEIHGIKIRTTSWGGQSLQYASKELRADKEVVYAALKMGNTCGSDLLQFASEELRRDRDLEVLQEGKATEATQAMDARLAAEDYSFC